MKLKARGYAGRLVRWSVLALPTVIVCILTDVAPANPFEKQIIINVVFDEIPGEIASMEVQVSGDGIDVPLSINFSSDNNRSEIPWIPFGLDRIFVLSAYDGHGLFCRGNARENVVVGKVTEVKIVCSKAMTKLGLPE